MINTVCCLIFHTGLILICDVRYKRRVLSLSGDQRITNDTHSDFVCDTSANRFDFLYQTSTSYCWKLTKIYFYVLKLALDLNCFSLSAVVKRLKVFLRCQSLFQLRLWFCFTRCITRLQASHCLLLTPFRYCSYRLFLHCALSHSIALLCCFQFLFDCFFTTTFSSFSIIFASMSSAQSVHVW